MFDKDKHFEPVTPSYADAKPFLLPVLGTLLFIGVYLYASASQQNQPEAAVPKVVTIDELATPASVPEGSVAFINSSGCQIVWTAPRASDQAGNFAHCEDVLWKGEAKEFGVDENVDAFAIMQDWNKIAPKAIH
jgi:hypothetical protein